MLWIPNGYRNLVTGLRVSPGLWLESHALVAPHLDELRDSVQVVVVPDDAQHLPTDGAVIAQLRPGRVLQMQYYALTGREAPRGLLLDALIALVRSAQVVEVTTKRRRRRV